MSQEYVTVKVLQNHCRNLNVQVSDLGFKHFISTGHSCVFVLHADGGNLSIERGSEFMSNRRAYVRFLRLKV